jgi:hypothetical protein
VVLLKNRAPDRVQDASYIDDLHMHAQVPNNTICRCLVTIVVCRFICSRSFPHCQAEGTLLLRRLGRATDDPAEGVIELFATASYFFRHTIKFRKTSVHSDSTAHITKLARPCLILK